MTGSTGEPPGFSLQIRDDVIPYPVFGIFVDPGETVDIAAIFTEGQGQVELEAEAGQLQRRDTESWRWSAPQAPGHSVILATEARSRDRIKLNVFVKTPFDAGASRLNGYRIGHYEPKALRGIRAYEPPTGFIEVNEQTRDILVAPHFTLGQFLCKQDDGPPRYVLLREPLLLKLEIILRELRTIGVNAQTLYVMSGFRTPWYNKSIGNTTKYSRHLYGGAADIFVDEDIDGRMDDLNGDGVISKADAELLAGLIRRNVDESWYAPFVGGLGIYGPAPHRGPFVHVDVRGYKARW